MFIETKEIGPEGLAVSRSIDGFRLPLSGDEAIWIDTVHLDGELLRVEEGISFAGRIGTRATLPCSRCLEEHAQPLDLPFDLVYTTAPEPPRGDEKRLDDELATRVHMDGTRIDIRALLAEQVYLGLPLKPLCRPDCQGLCPKCGINLNEGACTCAEERTEDPRLRILKSLL